MITVVDDHLVLELLLGRSIAVDGAVTTTVHWWWRLAAAMRRRAGGALSGPSLALASAERAALIATIDELGTLLEIADTREVLPVAADLAAAHRLNLLAAEALAVCVVDEADLAVGVDNPPLARAAEALGITYAVV